MQNTKPLSELLNVSGKRLSSLKAKVKDRSSTLLQVRAALAPKLAESVITAGLESGRLTIGVTSSVWASRLRYSTKLLRDRVSASSGVMIQQVRVRVVPPGT